MASRPPRCRCSSSSHDRQPVRPQGADGDRQCRSTTICGATWRTNPLQAQVPVSNVVSVEAWVRLAPRGMHIRTDTNHVLYFHLLNICLMNRVPAPQHELSSATKACRCRDGDTCQGVPGSSFRSLLESVQKHMGIPTLDGAYEHRMLAKCHRCRFDQAIWFHLPGKRQKR